MEVVGATSRPKRLAREAHNSFGTNFSSAPGFAPVTTATDPSVEAEEATPAQTSAKAIRERRRSVTRLMMPEEIHDVHFGIDFGAAFWKMVLLCQKCGQSCSSYTWRWVRLNPPPAKRSRGAFFPAAP